MKAKTVVILGAGGFLGRYLQAEFATASYQVVGVDRSFASSESILQGVQRCSLALGGPDASEPELRELLQKYAPELLIHAAGLASVPLSVANQEIDFFSHVVLTDRILRAVAAEAPRCRVVYLSSAAVYGQPEDLPIREAAAIHPISPYGFHKRMAELLLERAVRCDGVAGVSARIFSAYGRGLQRQVVWEACAQAVRLGQVELQGTGRETRDFIHGRDVARAIRILAEKSAGVGEAVNVASGVETSIREVAEGAARLGGSREAKFAGQQRVGDPERWVADISQIREMGFAPAVSFAEGLAEVFHWAQELHEAGAA